MASKTSITSILILLLITCNNSLPIELPNDSSTLENEFTSTIGQTDYSTTPLDDRTPSVEPVSDRFILEDESTTHVENLHDSSTQDYEFTTVAIHEDEANKQLASDEESSSLASDRSNNDELTTPDQGEYPEDITISSTTDELLFFSSSPLTFTSEIMPSNDESNENIAQESSSTTVELTTEPDQSLASTDDAQVEAKTDLPHDDIETEPSVVESESKVSEEAPSVDSSEKATESVVSDQSEEKPEPANYDKSAQSSEESEQSTTTISDEVESVVEDATSDD